MSDWHPDWLTPRQKEELNCIFDFKQWHSLEKKEEIRDLIRKVKAEYDKTMSLADQEPEVFVDHLKNRKVRGWRVVVWACVIDMRGSPFILSQQWIGGRPTIFDKLRPGNPDWKLKATMKEAVEAVEALIEENGAAAYKMRNGAEYPSALLEDAGERLGVSARTVRRRLDEGGWQPPPSLYV